VKVPGRVIAPTEVESRTNERDVTFQRLYSLG
jgi:hypothetical protein